MTKRRTVSSDTFLEILSNELIVQQRTGVLFVRPAPELDGIEKKKKWGEMRQFPFFFLVILLIMYSTSATKCYQVILIVRVSKVQVEADKTKSSVEFTVVSANKVDKLAVGVPRVSQNRQVDASIPLSS